MEGARLITQHRHCGRSQVLHLEPIGPSGRSDSTCEGMARSSSCLIPATTPAREGACAPFSACLSPAPMQDRLRTFGDLGTTNGLTRQGGGPNPQPHPPSDRVDLKTPPPRSFIFSQTPNASTASFASDSASSLSAMTLAWAKPGEGRPRLKARRGCKRTILVPLPLGVIVVRYAALAAWRRHDWSRSCAARGSDVARRPGARSRAGSPTASCDPRWSSWCDC